MVASIPGTILMKAKVIIEERKESESEKIKEEPETKPGGKYLKQLFFSSPKKNNNKLERLNMASFFSFI